MLIWECLHSLLDITTPHHIRYDPILCAERFGAGGPSSSCHSFNGPRHSHLLHLFRHWQRQQSFADVAPHLTSCHVPGACQLHLQGKRALPFSCMPQCSNIVQAVTWAVHILCSAPRPVADPQHASSMIWIDPYARTELRAANMCRDSTRQICSVPVHTNCACRSGKLRMAIMAHSIAMPTPTYCSPPPLVLVRFTVSRLRTLVKEHDDRSNAQR